MTQEQIDCFKNDVRREISDEVQSQFNWMKWVLGGIITLLLGVLAFEASNMREISKIKIEYITKSEFDDENNKLKLEITKKFALPVQLVMAQMKQVKAKLVDKNQRELDNAKEEEYKVMQEMIRLNYDILRGGGK